MRNKARWKSAGLNKAHLKSSTKLLSVTPKRRGKIPKGEKKLSQASVVNVRLDVGKKCIVVKSVCEMLQIHWHQIFIFFLNHYN